MAYEPSFGAFDADRDTLPAIPADAPFRIAILADFSGRANAGTFGIGAEIAGRKAHQPVPGNLDAVLEKIAPKLKLAFAGDGAEIELTYSSLDDFHPERLLKDVDLLLDLKDLRDEVDSSRFESIAETWVEWARNAGGPLMPSDAPARGRAIPDVETLDALKEWSGRPTVEDLDAASPADLHERAIGPRVPTGDVDRDAFAQAADAALHDVLRQIVHHPDQQALEAAWLGVDWILRRPAKAPVEFVLYDVSAEEFAADLASSDELSTSGVYELLGPNGFHNTGKPWALIVGLYDFLPTAVHAEVLGRMARIAEVFKAPFLAGIDDRIADLEFALEGDADDAWQALRAMPEAGWIGLGTPKFLLRLPFGENYKPFEDYPFEEFSPEEGERGLLWGNAALAVAGVLTQAFALTRWKFKPGAAAELPNMAVFTRQGEDEDERIAVAVAKTFTTKVSQKVVKFGGMPLMAVRGRDAIEVAKVVSPALEPTELLGRWEPPEGGLPPPRPGSTMNLMGTKIEGGVTGADYGEAKVYSGDGGPMPSAYSGKTYSGGGGSGGISDKVRDTIPDDADDGLAALMAANEEAKGDDDDGDSFGSDDDSSSSDDDPFGSSSDDDSSSSEDDPFASSSDDDSSSTEDDPFATSDDDSSSTEDDPFASSSDDDTPAEDDTSAEETAEEDPFASLEAVEGDDPFASTDEDDPFAGLELGADGDTPADDDETPAEEDDSPAVEDETPAEEETPAEDEPEPEPEPEEEPEPAAESDDDAMSDSDSDAPEADPEAVELLAKLEEDPYVPFPGGSTPVLVFRDLIQPISEDEPAGVSVPFALREKLEEARKEVDPSSFAEDDPRRPEEPKYADWVGIQQMTIETLTEGSKDLLLAARLTEALAKQYGFAGLRDGLHLMRLLAVVCWNRVLPEIEDPDEDLEIRAAPFHWLDDPDRGARFPTSVRMLPLMQHGGKAISALDWKLAQEGKGSVSKDDFDVAVQSCPYKQLHMNFLDADYAFKEINLLLAFLDRKMGSTAPELSKLRQALGEGRTLLEQVVKKKGPPVSEDGTVSEDGGSDGGDLASSDGGGGAMMGGGMIGTAMVAGSDGGTVVVQQHRGLTRADIYKQLERLSDLLQKIEPHSPVPYLIQKAVAFGSLPFPQLMKALIRDLNVLTEMNRELGIKDESEPPQQQQGGW